MKPLCGLQEWHEVDLSAWYKNDLVCYLYIATKEHHNVLKTLSGIKSFSVQAQFGIVIPKQIMVRLMYTVSFHLKLGDVHGLLSVLIQQWRLLELMIGKRNQ